MNDVSQSVLTSIRGTTAWLRLNRPEAANAINEQMRAELAAAFDEAAGNPAVRTIVITGNGKNFAAGSDVRELRALTPPESVALSGRIADFHSRVERVDKPVIAAVHGWCLGGGFELALACDIRIASRSARFGLPEPTLGLIAGGGGIPRLARLVGPGVARHMCLTAEVIDSSSAMDRRIITGVVEDSELEEETTRLAERIATLAPLAVAQAKRVLAASDGGDMANAVAFEARACGLCVGTEDYREGTQAFLEKRPPQFSGR